MTLDDMPIPETDPPAQFIRQRTPAWFAARKGRITASLAGAILGLNPFCSARKAWRILTGREIEVSNHHMERGVALEEPARRLYEARHGVKVEEAGFVVHPKFPFLGASPDGLLGSMGVLEIKCPASLPSEVPPYHMTQMMVQMSCRDRWFADYFAYAGLGQIFERRIHRDIVAECAMLVALGEWYAKYVLAGVEPPKAKRGSRIAIWGKLAPLPEGDG